MLIAVFCFCSKATTPCDKEMTEEPITSAFDVKEIKTDGKVTALYYPNTEGVVIVKKPQEGVVYTPTSKDNVRTFQIVNNTIKCNSIYVVTFGIQVHTLSMQG